jgi:hypothetical protein
MNLKRLAEISPVIGAFLIFIGYLKLHLYYSHWDINIANYLDFSEITLSFLNDTNTVLFLTLMMLLQMTLGIVTLTTIDNKIKTETSKIQADNSNSGSQTDEFLGLFPTIDKAIEENHKPVVIVLFILTAIFVILFLCFLNLTSLYISFVLFIQLLALFLDSILGIKDEKTLVQTSFVIILLGFTYCLAKYDIKQTEISTKQITLQSNSNENICTDKNFIFIGKTNNYYFFFDKVKNQSTIIQGTSISKTTTTN